MNNLTTTDPVFYLAMAFMLIASIWLRIDCGRDIRAGKKNIFLYLLYYLSAPFVMLSIFVWLGIIVQFFNLK